MNVERVKEMLKEQYPGVDIKETTHDEDGKATEIVGEIDREAIGSDRDVAVVVADKSDEHYHKVTTEEYEIIKGGLRVFRDGQPTDVEEGERIVITPGTRHWVEGDETWFYCFSTPDWTPDDFHLVTD
jgi:mannose-6-phosphate isomerase-like protein (cupin superfamily)